MTKKIKNYNNILISLDCMLDTRLGTVSRINNDALNKILLSDTYHKRDEDVFEGVDRETYRKLYAARDVETLASSLLTNIVPLVRHLVGKLKEQSIVRPFHDGAQIIINTYPYKLTSEENDAICKAMAVWMQGLAPVTSVSYSPRELTPLHCKSNYSLMLMYDYGDWLEVNAELFLKTQIPEVTLFVPAIYFVNKPTAEELSNMDRNSVSPMKAIETLAAGIISLELIDVMFFSILNERFKDIKL